MNEKNLKPLNERTKSEQREIQSKGGKASGKARAFRSTVKKRLKETPELMEELCDMVIDKALSGDLKALEMLIELNGESPKQQEIKLKERDMKLKEKAFEKDNW